MLNQHHPQQSVPQQSVQQQSAIAQIAAQHTVSTTQAAVISAVAQGAIASIASIALATSLAAVSANNLSATNEARSHQEALVLYKDNANQSKTSKLALQLLLLGTSVFAIQKGIQIDRIMGRRKQSAIAQEMMFQTDIERGLATTDAKGQMKDIINAAQTLTPMMSELKKLRESGIPFAYLASVASGQGLEGIIRYEAMREAQEEQIRVETHLAQQQVQMQQQAQVVQVTQALPENAERIMRVAGLPNIQLAMQWRETIKAPNVVREVFVLSSGVDRLGKLENELSLEFGSAVMCGTHGEGKIYIEVARKDRDFPTMPNRQWVEGEAKLVLGQNTKGELILDLSHETSPHLLIGGTTGGGKTFSGLRPIVYSLLKQGTEVIVVGGKRFDYQDLCEKMGLKFYDNEYAYQFASKFAEECKEFRKMSVAEINNQQRRVLVIDEYSETVSATRSEGLRIGQEEGLDNPDKFSKQLIAEYDENLCSIGRIGRALKRHVVLATQRVALRSKNDPDGLPTTVRGNLPGCIAFRCRDANEGNLILPSDGARAVNLLGKGDAIAIAGSLNERFQGYGVVV